MKSNTIYQVTAKELESFGEEIINKVLEKNVKQPDKYISVSEYDRINGTKRQTTLKNLREGILEGKQVGKFWHVKV